MKTFQRLSILLFTLLFLSRLSAQQPLLHHYTVQNGLPSNTIYYALQDSRGFIWFCTDMGVSRFDGHSFENFTSDDGLPDNEIFTMAEDRYQRCWLACYNKEPAYIFNGKVYTTANDQLCRDLARTGVQFNYQLLIDRHGNLIVGQEELYAVLKDSLMRYSPGYTLHKTSNYYFIHQHKEHIVNPYATLYDPVNGYRKIIARTLISAAFYNAAHLYLNLRNHTLSGDFYDIDLTTTPYIKKRIQVPVLIYDFAPKDDRTTWVCTENGVYTYVAGSGKIDTSHRILPGLPVNKVFTDSEKNRWFLTLGAGIYMQPADGPLIYKNTTGNDILAMSMMPDGTLVTGFANGCISVSKNNSSKKIALPPVGSKNNIRFILSLNDQEVLACNDRGLHRVNIHTGVAKHVKYTAGKALTKNGSQYLFGYRDGIGSYRRDSDTVQVLLKTTTISIAGDGDGKAWLGTLNGLYYFEKNVVNKFNRDSILSKSRITALALVNGTLIIGTHINGIYTWNNQELSHFDEGSGLGSNIIRKFVTGKNGQVWIQTEKGWDKVTVRQGAKPVITPFSAGNGLMANSINDIVSYHDTLYMAVGEKVISLPEKQPLQSPKSPAVYILSVYAKDTLLHYPGSIQVNYKQNNFRVNYTGISFYPDNKMMYKYFLEGGSKDTIYTAQSTLNLSAVKPGSYRLFIWAGDKNNWSTKPAVLLLTITPPYWQTPLFISCAVMMGISGLYFFSRYRVKKIRTEASKKASQEKRVAELELQTLRAQINPHFMFNALNSIQHYYTQQDERKANYYLSSFAGLIRKTISNASVHWLTLDEEMDMVRAYVELEQMRFKNTFDCEIIIDPLLHSPGIKVPAMLVQPYVENAINHGLRHLADRKGQLTITCEIKDQLIIIRIDDNGVGFEKAAQLNSRPAGYTSMGMKITHGRIDTINQAYKTTIRVAIIRKQPDTEGTIVEIRMPLKPII